MTSPSRQLIKGDRRMFSSSDDTTMLKQIQGTHAPDGRDVDVRPILDIVEDVFRRAAAPKIHDPMVDPMDDKITEALLEGHGMLEALAFIIQKVSCEMTCKCSGGGDAHSTAMSLLHMLSNYSWDAKVVITLAALAITYGEFWLVVQLFAAHPLAKSVAVLKQLPDMMEHSNALKSRFDALNNLILAMLDVTKSILEFRLLPHQYISPDQPPLAIAITHIPTAAYWTIRSVVACATQIASLIGMSFEYISSTTEAWELSSLAHKERNIHEHLMQQLALCYQHIGEKKHAEAYETLVHLFDLPQLDNIKILKHLIYLKDDIQPLYQGSTKTRVHVETLRRKTVLLLISDLEVSHEEIMILDHIYRESRTRPELQYEIVWIPIVDHSAAWSDVHQQRFEQLQSMMSWHTLHHPSLLEPAAMKYIKDVWRFQKRMILVVLDPQGKVASPNALHMMLIWGNIAFPFTVMKEESLWREETWRLELLMDSIDPQILDWIAQGKHICVYGGEDIDWIRRFTTTTKQIAHVANLDIELIYVGKSNAKERLKKTIATIHKEQLSGYWVDPTSYWYFWTRLECMLYSKMQHGMDVERDRIMQEVMTLLSYDGSDQGWATIWLGSLEMARAKGDTMLESFSKYEEWEENARTKGFVPALREHLLQMHTPHHCNRLILPGIEGGIPEKVVCAECGRAMEKYFMYRCCTDE
ncbi:hypothetical protein vseg_003981 [Gypsophila vaccaria]